MADISFNIACKKLKIAQIAELNQLFQFLHLLYIYGHSFYELSRMLMRKNVNNDVSKHCPYMREISIAMSLQIQSDILYILYFSITDVEPFLWKCCE